MNNHVPSPTPCPHCREPMKLVHTIAPLEGLSAIFAFGRAGTPKRK
jgi:hypothetical protein